VAEISVLTHMETKKGTLEIVGGLSFLKPSGIQLVMRNTPPGGTFNQRAAAAKPFFAVIGAGNGSSISVTGDTSGEVFLIDSATK